MILQGYDWIVFCDESGISAGPCYSIGAFIIRSQDLTDFHNWFTRTAEDHGASGEIKWKKIKNSHGRVNFLLDLFHTALSHNYCRLQFMVVHKWLYDEWTASGAETAFYKSYTHLLNSLAQRIPGTYQVVIDQRSDRYPRQTETMKLIANRMLRQRGSSGLVVHVEKADSRHHAGLQAIDVLVGAINAAHQIYLDPQVSLQPAKRVALIRLAEVLGWDHLHYDTHPNDTFNIWHFPKQYRGVPQSRQRPEQYRRPQFVGQDDIKMARAIRSGSPP